MSKLWYTAYVVSSLTFLALAYVEWQVPGFVSYVFPLYIPLLIAIGCGLATLVTGKQAGKISRFSFLGACLTGVIGSLLVFNAAQAFGAFRLILALIVLILPFCLLKGLDDVKD